MNVAQTRLWQGQTLTPAHKVKKLRLCHHNPVVHRQVIGRLDWALKIVRQHKGFENFQDPDVGYFDRALAAGKALTRDGRYILAYNNPLFEQNLAENLHETVIHELAHLVVMYAQQHRIWSDKPVRYRPHGREWKKVMITWFSVSPQRTHSMDTSTLRVRRQRRWKYRCECREHLLSTVCHNRVLKKTTGYKCIDCGHALRAA